MDDTPKFQDESIAPMHTAEHMLNGTMVKLHGCKRSRHSHIERRKSKCDYPMPSPLTEEQIRNIERIINDAIDRDLPITFQYINIQEAASSYDLDRLPDDAASTIRIVHVGDFDSCPCVGAHVRTTREIGHFRISSYRYADGVQRIVFRLD